MKKISVLVLGSLLLTACSSGLVKTSTESVNSVNENIAPFPKPADGMNRSVINLPAIDNENSRKVELVIGRNMLVDCNTRALLGSVTEKQLTGWGYQYYEVSNIKGAISTMMACPTDEQKEAFVTVNSQLGLLPYNSRLPIVVYAPNDIQVKYKIWSTDNVTNPAKIDN